MALRRNAPAALGVLSRRTRRRPLLGRTTCVGVLALLAGCFRSGFADHTPPHPPTVHAVSDDRSPYATIAAHPSDRDVVAFSCRIDDGVWHPCASPFSPELAPGAHDISVRALDRAGNASLPSTRRLHRGQLPKGLDGTVRALAVLPDQALVAAGSFSRFRPEALPGVVHISTGGELLPTCLAGSGFNSWVKAIVAVEDGYVIGGFFTAYKGVPVGRIVKIDANCNIDPVFQQNVGAGFSFNVEALAVAGNALFVGGSYWAFDETNVALCLTRLDLQGNLDPQFQENAGSGIVGVVHDLAVVGDALFVAGTMDNYNGEATPLGLLKLDLAGNLDRAFSGGAGAGFDAPTGSVMAVGSALYVTGGFSRYGAEEAPDHLTKIDSVSGAQMPGFTANAGSGFNGDICDLVSDGAALYVAGEFSAYADTPIVPGLVKLDAQGRLDAAFQAHLGAGGVEPAYPAIGLSGDALLVIDPALRHGPGGRDIAHNIAKLRPDGTLDEDFQTRVGTGFDREVLAIARADDALFVGGRFDTLDGTASRRLAKLSFEGAPDLAFATQIGQGVDGQVEALVVDDDTLYVAGYFDAFDGDGTIPHHLIKLDHAGNVDAAFSANAGSGFDAEVLAVAVARDALFAAGWFTRYNDQPTSTGIIKLDRDGVLDPVFTANAGTGVVEPSLFSAALLPADDALFLAGHFVHYNGALVPWDLVKLRLDGTLDPVFLENVRFGFGCCYIDALALGEDGIYVAGDFHGFEENDVTRGLFKIDFEGRAVAAFEDNVGMGANGRVRALAVSEHGVYAGGEFGGFSEQSRAGLCRVDAQGRLDDLFLGNVDRGE